MNEPTKPTGPNESTWAARIKSILGWRIKLEGRTGEVSRLVGTVGPDGEPVFGLAFEDGAEVQLPYSEIMRECVLIEPPGGPVNWEQYPATRPYKPGSTY